MTLKRRHGESLGGIPAYQGSPTHAIPLRAYTPIGSEAFAFGTDDCFPGAIGGTCPDSEDSETVDRSPR